MGTLLRGGVIHSPEAPRATAMLVIDGAVAWLGGESGADAHRDQADKVVGLNGALLAPAFVDAHVHVTATGLHLSALDLSDTRSRGELLDRVAARVRAEPGALITGHGWDEAGWADPMPPSRAELDTAAAGASVYLSRTDLHSALVSSALIGQVGGLPEGPDVSAPHGSRTGPITGEAHHLVRRHLNASLTPAQRSQAQRCALSHAAAAGVACLHEAAGPDISGSEDLGALLDLAGTFRGPEVIAYWGELISAIQAGARELPGDAAGAGGDIFVDGSLGSRTAWLRQPYGDDPKSTGTAQLSAEQVAEHLVECTRRGIQAGFHAIGDAAIDAVVAGIEAAVARCGSAAIRAGRHRLEHLSMATPAHIAALAGAGVIASVQPLFDARWGGPGGLYEQRLGPQRAAEMHDFAAFQRAGVGLALGSDSPVTPIQPWEWVRAAMWHHRPDARLSGRAAFAAATRGGWRAARRDDAGVLAVGWPATFAIWRADELAVQAPDPRVANWSTDPRSGTAGLPVLDSRAHRTSLPGDVPRRDADPRLRGLEFRGLAPRGLAPRGPPPGGPAPGGPAPGGPAPGGPPPVSGPSGPGYGRLPLRLLAGCAAGLAMACAFPPYGWLRGWLLLPAFAVLLAAHRGLRPRQAALVGLVSGTAHFLLLLTWLRVLGVDAWIAVSVACASFWVVLAAVLPWLLSRRWWVLIVPVAWVAMEAARARVPWGGFPWGRLAFAQADSGLVNWAVLGGPALLSLVVALAATSLLAAADAIRQAADDRARGLSRTVARGLPSAVAWLMVPLALAVGAAVLGRVDWGGAVLATDPLAIVQGNVPRLGLDFASQRRAVLDNHVSATQALAAEVRDGAQPAPVAGIWPENSSDISPLAWPDAADQIDRAARAVGVPLLVGTILSNPDKPGTVLNVSLVWDPATGPGERYVKRHPVPFGEYLPMRGILSRFITRFQRIPHDFVPGDSVGRIQLGPVPIAVVICFEVAQEPLIAEAVRAGGQVLVVQTNNATYGGTGQPEQQLAITRVQAVAAGRATLVAATSGISAVIDSRGHLLWRSQEFTTATAVPMVPRRAGLTPAVRSGPALELAAVVTTFMVLASGRFRGSRRPDATIEA